MFVNILAEVDGKADLAYDPIKIELLESEGVPSWVLSLIYLGVGVLFVVVLAALYFYNKSKKAEARLEYETQDIRNIGNIPKSVAELSEIKMKTEGQKYSTLTEESSTI